MVFNVIVNEGVFPNGKREKKKKTGQTHQLIFNLDFTDEYKMFIAKYMRSVAEITNIKLAQNIGHRT